MAEAVPNYTIEGYFRNVFARKPKKILTDFVPSAIRSRTVQKVMNVKVNAVVNQMMGIET